MHQVPEVPYKPDWFERPDKSVAQSQLDPKNEASMLGLDISDDESDLPHNQTLAHTTMKRKRTSSPQRFPPNHDNPLMSELLALVEHTNHKFIYEFLKIAEKYNHVDLKNAG